MLSFDVILDRNARFVTGHKSIKSVLANRVLSFARAALSLSRLLNYSDISARNSREISLEKFHDFDIFAVSILTKLYFNYICEYFRFWREQIRIYLWEFYFFY